MLRVNQSATALFVWPNSRHPFSPSWKKQGNFSPAFNQPVPRINFSMSFLSYLRKILSWFILTASQSYQLIISRSPSSSFRTRKFLLLWWLWQSRSRETMADYRHYFWFLSQLSFQFCSRWRNLCWRKPWWVTPALKWWCLPFSYRLKQYDQ
jgi:hypothetical protein